MSLLSTKDFCKMAGVKPATLRQHINRGKVIKTGNLIDIEHPTNIIYLHEQVGNNNQSSITETPNKPTPGEIKVSSHHEKLAESIITAPSKSTDLVLRKKIADALISERRAQELYLKNQKLLGKLMPIEIVEKVLIINIQTIFRSFEASCENTASVYNERLGGDRASLAEMITSMRLELECAINSAKQQSHEEIKALMLEYSSTRSRGEKK